MLSKVLLALFGFARAVVGEGLQTCGGAQYYPSQYTCFDNNFLCPTGPSGTYLRCNDACYLPSQYAYVSIIASRIFSCGEQRPSSDALTISLSSLILTSRRSYYNVVPLNSIPLKFVQLPKTYEVILTLSTVCLLRQ